MKKSILDEKAVLFAIHIIKLSKVLNEQRDFIISKQILRSGTSIGANIRESQSAESSKDFIHKLSISLKEANETLYWLELLTKSEMINKELYTMLNFKCTELQKMLTSSILTMKKKLK